VTFELYKYVIDKKLQLRGKQCRAFCLFSCLTTYNILIHDRKLSISNVSYHFEVNRVINDIFKRFYSFLR